MKKYLRFISITAALLTFLLGYSSAQSNQTVTNGNATTPQNFTGNGCVYNWINSDPSIGLPASGTGNIGSFTAINNGSTPVTATIKATPSPTGFAYIANYGANTVTVISTATSAVTATVTVGAGPQGVTVSPDGRWVYVTCDASNEVYVINTANNSIIATIPVGKEPGQIAISPNGSRIYVTNFASNTISIINAATNMVIGTVLIGSTPQGIVISPNGSRVYISSQNGQTITVLNTANNTIAATINNAGYLGMVISPDGSKIYATGLGGKISVINTANNTVSATIVAGSDIHGLALSPDGNTLYGTDASNNSVVVINAITRAIITTIPVGSYPQGIAVSPDGGIVYVANGDGDVSVISTAYNVVVKSLNIGTNLISLGTFIRTNTVCSGSPVTFTITVKPSAAKPVVTRSTVSGTIRACQGMASEDPDIAQFTVAGTTLQGDITATAPAGFEVSANPDNGYGKTVTFAQVGGTVTTKTIYVRSAVGATGKLSGDILLSTPGTSTDAIAVTGQVNPLPTVNAVPNQTVTGGTNTAAINFTGAGNTFTWTNNTPGIGLPASGKGNIASFTAINNGNAPVIATVTVTPSSNGVAYIPNYNDGTVSLIDLSTNSLIAAINVGQGALGVAVNDVTKRMYITNQISNTISVIDLGTKSVISTITLTTGLSGIAVSPDGSRAYAVNLTDGTATVINTANNAILKIIKVGTNPLGAVVSPDGSKVYVSDYLSNTISVINTATNTVASAIPVDTGPFGLSLSSDGSKLYVANELKDVVSVINTATNAVITKIAVQSGPYGVAVSPDGSRVYVSNFISKTVSVINTANNTVTATIPVGNAPYGVSISSDGSLVYVSNSGSNSVSVISPTTNTVIATVPVGNSPLAFGSFISEGSGCPGTPITFTITVNPSKPFIIAGTTTGNISACVGSASSSPNVQQFTVSGGVLTNNITVTAPAGFEISLTAGSGYAKTLTLTQSGGAVNSTIIYVRSAAADPPGSISGNVTLTSSGAIAQTVAVTGVVNALPTVNPVANQTINAGTNTTAVNFTGTGNTFTWTNNSPAIGLAANGTGDIPPFTGVNTGNAPVTASITVVPTSAHNGYAYIANDDGTISVINITTNVVESTIAVGSQPSYVSVSPDGSKVYVANFGSNNISVIGTATKSLIATIPVTQPTAIAFSPDGSKAYITGEGPGSVSVINTAGNTVTATFLTPAGGIPAGILVSPDGNRLYVENSITNTSSVLLVMNSSTGSVIASIPVGITPTGIGQSPDGSRVYVANEYSDNVMVINTATNTLIATVPVGSHPYGLTVSPDGGRVYVSNNNENTVSVINTATNAVIATIVTPATGSPTGVSVSADGSLLYVVNHVFNNVSVVNTSSNTITGTINVGPGPVSTGNFIAGTSSCIGLPITFTITVKPPPPVVIISTATGSISACAGSPSSSPDIQQFTVSGANLTGNITATAPAGFEMSLTAGGGYTNSLTFVQSNGAVSNIIIYVRSAASAPSGNISGNITLSSAGVANQIVPVSGVVNALPVVNSISSQTVIGGVATTAISFTGAADTYNWANDTPAIGLGASGTGDIPSFLTTPNNTGVLIKATVTVTPSSSVTGCSGMPVTFTITVNPTPPPVIVLAIGTMTGLTTVYGTPSSSTSFGISGSNLQAGIVMTAPPGFEVSADNTNFNKTITVLAAGSTATVSVYIRLAATTPVGDYSGNIVLSTTATNDVEVHMPNSTVTPAPLTITANNLTKAQGANNPVLTATYTGFVNGDTPAQLTPEPELTTSAVTLSPPGEYPITISPVTSPNYTITLIDGILTVTADPGAIVIPNAFTPNGDGVNDVWEIKALKDFPECIVSVFSRYGSLVYQSRGYTRPWDGTRNSSALPVGAYYYLIKFQTSAVVLSGPVTIIR